MASEGPRSAGSGADNSGVGTQTWSNPTNITSSNDSRATVTVSPAPQISHYLVSSAHGFTIPGGSTINGIVVEIERSTGAQFGSFGRDNRVRIVKGGAIGATDKASASEWPESTDATASYGSSSDLWGETWTAADINDSGFGAALAVTNTGAVDSVSMRVDHMRITVYYTAAAGGNPWYYNQQQTAAA